jgi:hypothetical protein
VRLTWIRTHARAGRARQPIPDDRLRHPALLSGIAVRSDIILAAGPRQALMHGPAYMGNLSRRPDAGVRSPPRAGAPLAQKFGGHRNATRWAMLTCPLRSTARPPSPEAVRSDGEASRFGAGRAG